ncbi:MAG: HlyD family secretion protein [Methyloceanibacter sp.]|nr:HlyD family secretion protein [Methyloceanibacter sp.]
MKGALRRLAIASITLAGGAFALVIIVSWWRGISGFETTDNAYVHSDITILSPRVAGYAVEITVDDNDKVEPKQTLVRIDPRDFRSIVEQRSAAVAQRKSDLVNLAARRELQAARIRVAGSALEAARARAEQTEADFRRADELVRRGSGTRQRFDETKAANLVALSNVTSASATLSLEKQQEAVLDAEEVSLKADLTAAEAELHEAKLKLEDTNVWAPLRGVVAERNTRVGEYVNVGTRLLAIVPVDGHWIEANYKETQIGRMAPGDRAQIVVDTYPDKVFCGYVESIAPASGSEFSLIPPDNATGNFTKIVRRFTVRLRLDEDQPDLELIRPGMSVVPMVALGSRKTGRAKQTLLSRLASLLSPVGEFACEKDGPTEVKPLPPRRLPEHPGLGSTESQ